MNKIYFTTSWYDGSVLDLKVARPLSIYGIKTFYIPKQFNISWLSLAKKWFKKPLFEGNYFHLTGHSWEIEKYDM